MAVGELAVKLRAETAEFERDMGRAAHMTTREMEAMVTRANVVGVAIGLAFTQAAGHGARLAAEMVRTADEFGKLAQRAGTTVESFSGLEFAARLSNVSAEQLAGAMKTLSTHMADAQAGTGRAADAFKALGITVESSRGSLKPTEQLMLELAERFKGMEDGAGKTAIAVRLFGGEGARLIPLLNQGAEGLRNSAEEAAKFGIIISSQASAAASDFNDNLTRLQASSRGFALGIMQDVVPALNRFAQEVLVLKQSGAGSLGAVFGALTTEPDAVGRLNEIRTTLESLKKTRLELMQPTLANQINQALPEWMGGDITTVNRQIAALEKERDYYTKLATMRADVDNFDASRFGKPRTAAPRLSDDAAGGGRAAKQMSLDELLARNATARLKSQEEAERSAEKAAEQLVADREKVETDAQKKIIDGWVKYAQAVNDADFTQQKALADMVNNGRSYTEVLEDLAKQSDRQSEQTARQLGMTFTSAFEDAIVNGKKLGDVVRGLGQDLQRIFVRKLVTEPLQDAVVEALKLWKISSSMPSGAGGGGGGGGLLSLLSGLIGGGGGAGIGYGAAGTAAASAVVSDGFGGFIPALAEGTPYVTQTGLALIHEGERVVPASENAAWGGGGRGMSIYAPITIDARGSDRGVEMRLNMQLERFKREVVPMVKDAARRGTQSRR